MLRMKIRKLHFECFPKIVFQQESCSGSRIGDDDKSVSSFIPAYSKNSENPIICCKYNKPIRNIIFNFNSIVSDLDIETNVSIS